MDMIYFFFKNYCSMILLLTYPDSSWAEVISYRYYVIKAKLKNGLFIQVHSPGLNMSGSIKPGVEILVTPFLEQSKFRICSHYILAMKLSQGLIGANPFLGNIIFKRILDLKIWDNISSNRVLSYQSECIWGASRFDFKLKYTYNSQSSTYLEIKSCFFKVGSTAIYPLKKIGTLNLINQIVYENKSFKHSKIIISRRSIKHFQQMALCKGILVFISQRNDVNTFKINPLENLLQYWYEQNKNSVLIKTFWKENGDLYYDESIFLDNSIKTGI